MLSISDRHLTLLGELKRHALSKRSKPRSAARSQPLRAELKPARHALKPPMRRADMRELVRDLKMLDAPQLRRGVGSSDTTEADDAAAVVLAAAELRDVGGPPLPKLDGVAAMVIEAGRKRHRGEA